MKNRIARLIILLFLIPSISFIPCGCSIFHKNPQAKAEKKKSKEDRKASKEYEKATQQHYKNQSKSTQKMMKSTKKRATAVNKPKKRGKLSSKKCF